MIQISKKTVTLQIILIETEGMKPEKSLRAEQQNENAGKFVKDLFDNHYGKKENAKGTYSLIDLYANSDGKLKPKTLYNSRKSTSGQVMRLPQPSTSETRTRSIAAPKNFATLSNHFSGAKVIQNFENPKNIVK
jgi:hypothetical protein